MNYFKERNIHIEPSIPVECQTFPDMSGKKILVMGGTRGIGLEVANLSFQMGADVFVVGRKHQKIPYFQIKADLDDPNEVKRIWDAVGVVDYVYNNVGFYFNRNILDTSTGEWDEVIARNLTNMFHLTKHGLANLNEGGTMVNMSSRPFLDKYYGWSAYTLAKMGVTIMTQAAAEEGKELNDIHAYAICPSRVDTRFRDVVFPDEDKTTRLSPEETATAIMYLFNRQLPNGQYYWIKKIYG